MNSDVITAIQNFHERDIFERSLNGTHVAFQEGGSQKTERFKHISLIGNIYKIISRLLTERLKKVMHKLVDDQQMAFIKRRRIMDVILIANEYIDSRIINKEADILCKLDIQKLLTI